MQPKKLVWIDLETTGLDPDREAILELGIIITDEQLEEVAGRSWLILHRDVDTLRAGCVDYVREMHDTNGLWHALKKKDAADPLPHVESFALEFIRKHCGLDWRGPMCGSTPSFDRGFLRNDMPTLCGMFTHRHIDVSSFKEWFRPHSADPERPATSPAHRVLADLQESIAALRSFRGVKVP